jgi:hypothetical protein
MPTVPTQKQDKDDKSNDVEPITVVRGVPESGSEEVEQVTVNNKPNIQESGSVTQTADEENAAKKQAEIPGEHETQEQKEQCWNCRADLDSKGVCATCGFEKDKLENATLNSERSRQARLRMVKEGSLAPNQV